MNRKNFSALVLWISCHVMVVAQASGFDSFVARIARQYKVDIAISPELIPRVDSLFASGTAITSVQELLRLLVKEEHMSYQLVDGNKLMLRMDDPAPGTFGALAEGFVLNQLDGTPLPYAAVSLKYTSRGCLSDENGHFALPVEDTTGKLVIHYLGYDEVTLPVTAFLHGSARVRMKLREVPLEEVTIIIPYKEVDQDPEAQSLNLTGFYLISEEQLLQGNAERMINSLTSYTPFSSDEGIRIRGAESKNSLLLMDGLPVYDPYHYYNIFSPFNSHYFSSVKLYKNNLPVPYGGRIDGMVQLASDRKKQQNHFVFDTDLLLTSMESELAIAPDLSLKLGGRVSHTNTLKDALSDSSVVNYTSPGHFNNENEWTTATQPTFNFYDINAGLTKSLGQSGKWYGTFFTSRDELKYTTRSELQTTNWEHEVLSIEQTYSSLDTWKNMGAATGAEIKTGLKTILAFDAFLSAYHKDESYSSKSDDDRDHYHHNMLNKGYQNSDLTSGGGKVTLQKKTSRQAGYLAGLDIQSHQVNFEAKENQTPYITQEQHELELTAFGEYHRQLFDQLDLYAGTRMTHLNSTGKLYALPNVRLNYFLSQRIHLKGAVSKNLQAVHELTVENRFGRELETLVLSEPSEGYPVLRSDKFMLGAGYSTMHLNIDAEVYYKKINGLARVSALMPDPGFNDPTTPDNFYQLLTGDGYASGLDLTVLYKKGKLESAVYYSLSKIAERYEELFNGDYYSPQEDRRHQVKVSGKYTFGRLETNLLMTYKSKAPYISYVRLEGHGGIDRIDQNAVVSYLPAYFSLDLGLDYAFRLFKQPAQLGVSLINATNHANIDEIQHVGRVPRDGGQGGGYGGFYLTQQTELLGRTGNVHFRIVL